MTGNKNNAIYVVGHVNPDTDAIASAMGYAWLLQDQGQNAIAARAGHLNPQTTWVLNHLKIEQPMLLTDASPRFSAISHRLNTAAPEHPLREVWSIANRTGGVAPIVDSEGKPYGLVTVMSLFDFLSRTIGSHPRREEMRIGELMDMPGQEAVDRTVPQFLAGSRIRDALNRILREERTEFWVVDETGRVIWGDELMILLSRSVLATHPGATIIAEAKCSQVLFDDIANHGGVPLMWKAGHSIIKAKMKETGAVLAGEMSGHIFFADRFYGFDDAAYAGARVMEILSKTDQPLSAMLADLPKTFSTPELRIDCPDEIKFDVVQKIAAYFAHDHKVITIDGARIIFDHGWGIVRASNTQAILVLRFEADSEEYLDEIHSEVYTSVAEVITKLKIR